MWMAAEPNSPALPYSQVEFLITPESRIRRMRITQDDLSDSRFYLQRREASTRRWRPICSCSICRPGRKLKILAIEAYV